MTWFALSDHDESWFADKSAIPGLSNSDEILTRGSLVIETRFPHLRRPKPLIAFSRNGAWPIHLSLQALPGGGLTFILDQGGDILHRVFNHAEAGRADILRITYSWDVAQREARLSLELAGQDKVSILSIASPRPIRLSHLKALMSHGADLEDRYISPKVLYIAASTAIEPVGPVPALMPETPIATPDGYRCVGALKRGDLVLTAEGRSVPVLHSMMRCVPARGSFAPISLRAPFFGLRRDITVSPLQKLVLSGSQVEYMFGAEAVLIQAGHLSGGAPVLRLPPKQRFVTYCQVVLPEHEALDAAGAEVESLYIGRIRRKPDALRASIFAETDRQTLPEHGQPAYQVLKAYDAATLADYRAA